MEAIGLAADSFPIPQSLARSRGLSGYRAGVLSGGGPVWASCLSSAPGYRGGNGFFFFLSDWFLPLCRTVAGALLTTFLDLN